MKIRPLHDKIIVKRTEAESKTESGLYIPDSAKDKTVTGEVLAVGPGKYNEKTGKRMAIDIPIGAVVLFSNQYVGNEVTVDGEEYLILGEDDIVGIEDE